MSTRRPLRICLVHYYDFDLDNRVQRQAVSLAARGDEVHVVGISGPRRFAVGAGSVCLHRIGVPKRRGSALDFLRGYLRFLGAATARCMAIDRTRGLDLLSMHNTPDFIIGAALWPKLRGVPVILDVHDTFPEFFLTKFGLGDQHPLARLIRAEERLSVALADAVVVVTDTAKERLVSRCAQRTDIRVVMNCPDHRVFGPSRSPVAMPAGGTIRLAYHGGTTSHYGVESLIRGVGIARRRLPRLELTVFGLFGPLDDIRALARCVDPHGIKVNSEPTPYAEIHGRLKEHHIGIVPTMSDRFTELLLPVKMLEYIHLGMPVAASRLPGISRYFAEDEVAYFEPGSPDSIARCVSDIVDHPREALRRAERSAQLLATMRWEIQEARYFDLIDELVDRAPSYWVPLRGRSPGRQCPSRRPRASPSWREKRSAPLGSRWSPSPQSASE
ncbi:MAG: glycosyltransferase [Solirubrobacterales bacterium]